VVDDDEPVVDDDEPDRRTDPGDARLAVRAAQARAAVDLLACSGADHRALEPFGSVVATDLGVDTPWSVQVSLAGPALMHGPTLPVPDELAAAREWAADRAAGRGYLVVLPAPVAAVFDRAAGDLRRHDELPVLALGAVEARRMTGTDGQEREASTERLEIGPPRDLDELLAAYGGWMEDLALAAGLVVAADLTRPRRRFLVARAGPPGRTEVVGCAMVWFAGGTAYLSGLGVLPGSRGRGYGRALAVEAARVGASAPVDAVWMYATDAGERLYRRVGFRPAGSVVRYRTDGPGRP
jgi:ribosomal protein S18 acetylase RimI-like enzyme